ncbi:MAG: HEAT repeat domain-containing protein [Armatimonadetes bacterium]|nr:HEAT repeat domain-containing protein [Armatimonadota bacterium]
MNREQINEQRINDLINNLKSRSTREVREEACEALVKIGAPAVPYLIQALEDGHACHLACKALGQIGDRRAVPHLIQVMKYWHARHAACQALGQIGDLQAVPHLIRTLEDLNGHNWFIRAAACRALGQIGAPEAARHLTYIRAKEADWFVRSIAWEALMRIGSRGTPFLIEVLGDEDEDTRRVACEAIEQIRDPMAVPALSLCEILGDSFASQTLDAIRQPALPADEACKAMVPIGEQAVPLLIRVLRNEGAFSAAREALVRIGVPAVPHLLRVIRNENADVRQGASEVLEQISDLKAVPYLIEALNDIDQFVRLKACEVLNRIWNALSPIHPKPLCGTHLVRLEPKQTTRVGDCQAHFFACRYCQTAPSNPIEGVREVIVVLDNQMREETVLQDGVLKVNWLLRRELPDYDRVQILKADAVAVEEFCIQVGNDTDEQRRERRKEVPCELGKGLDRRVVNMVSNIFNQIIRIED